MWKWKRADKECGIKSGQTNHMKNHTILWTHLDWTMFNQGSMLLWMYRAMNEKLASEHAYDAWWYKWYQRFGIGGWSAVKAYGQFLHKVIFAIRLLYFWKALGSRMSEIMLRIVKHANSKNKYTNTLLHKYWVWWSACKTPHMLYYWKALDIRVSKSMFPNDHCTNAAIQKHKYTNTQIKQRTGCKT